MTECPEETLSEGKVITELTAQELIHKQIHPPTAVSSF